MREFRYTKRWPHLRIVPYYTSIQNGLGARPTHRNTISTPNCLHRTIHSAQGITTPPKIERSCRESGKAQQKWLRGWRALLYRESPKDLNLDCQLPRCSMAVQHLTQKGPGPGVGLLTSATIQKTHSKMRYSCNEGGT